MNMKDRVAAFVGFPVRVKIGGQWYVGNLNMGGDTAPWDGTTLQLVEIGTMRRAFPDLGQGFPRLFTFAEVEDVKNASD